MRSPVAPPKFPSDRSTHFRRPLAALLGLAIVVLVAGCDETPTGPDLASPDIAADLGTAGFDDSDQPYYWYNGNRVFLEPEAGRFVVQPEGPDPVGAAEEALAELELGAASVERRLVKGHRILEIAGAGSDEARKVASRLHDHTDFSFASPVYRTVRGGTEVLALNTVTVQFREGVSVSEIKALNEELGTTIEREPVAEKGWSYHIVGYPETGERDPLAIAAAFAEHELTECADPNRVAPIRPAGTGEPFFEYQWHFENEAEKNGVPVDINVVPAWDITTGSSTIRVGVLDSGVDADHEDLPNVIAGEDAFEGEPDVPGSEIDPAPEDFHGTAVAGIIGADHNGIGVAGIAPEVEIVAYRIFWWDEEEQEFLIADFQLIADCINQAWSFDEVDVINNSWTLSLFYDEEDGSDALDTAIEDAANDGRGGLGTPVVQSSGNSGLTTRVEPPAHKEEVLAVSAMDSVGDRPSYSSFGFFEESGVAIAAPSSEEAGGCNGQITTTDLMGPEGCADGPQGDVNYSTTFGGTSAAAPQVSGAIALLLSENPSLHRGEVEQFLAESADDWGDAEKFGAGKLNVNRLLGTASGGSGSTGDCEEDDPNQLLPVC